MGPFVIIAVRNLESSFRNRCDYFFFVVVIGLSYSGFFAVRSLILLHDKCNSLGYGRNVNGVRARCIR